MQANSWHYNHSICCVLLWVWEVGKEEEEIWKMKYLTNKMSFLGEINTIFHNFLNNFLSQWENSVRKKIVGTTFMGCLVVWPDRQIMLRFIPMIFKDLSLMYTQSFNKLRQCLVEGLLFVQHTLKVNSRIYVKKYFCVCLKFLAIKCIRKYEKML